jgi:hypothetical protein
VADHITQELPVQAEPEDIVVTRPVADVLGYPLPGLTVFLTIRWDLGALAAIRGPARSASDEAPGDRR